MKRDPIVEEARRAGEALFARHGNDMHAVAEFLRRRGREAGRATVSRSPKPAKPRVRAAQRKVG